MRSAFIIVIIAFTILFFNPMPAPGQVLFMINPNVGKEAQDFTLKTLDGGEVSLNEFCEGKKAIFLFWSTWCPQCRETLDKLTQKRQEIEDKDIKIVLIDVGESKEVVQKYFKKNDIHMDIFLDEAMEVSEVYGVIGIPTFYFVGEDGIIRKVQNNFPQDFENPFYGV